MPSTTIAWARVVAVVVPSPATSLVRVAAGTRGDHPQQPRAHVLERIGQLERAGDDHARVGDQRSVPRLSDDHVATARAERELDGLGHRVDAFQQASPRILMKGQ